MCSGLSPAHLLTCVGGPQHTELVKEGEKKNSVDCDILRVQCFLMIRYSLPERVSQKQQPVSFPRAWQQRAQRFSTAWRAESGWHVRHWSALGPVQCLHELSHGSQVSCHCTISQISIQCKWKSDISAVNSTQKGSWSRNWTFLLWDNNTPRHHHAALVRLISLNIHYELSNNQRQLFEKEKNILTYYFI